MIQLKCMHMMRWGHTMFMINNHYNEIIPLLQRTIWRLILRLILSWSWLYISVVAIVYTAKTCIYQIIIHIIMQQGIHINYGWIIYDIWHGLAYRRKIILQ